MALEILATIDKRASCAGFFLGGLLRLPLIERGKEILEVLELLEQPQAGFLV